MEPAIVLKDVQKSFGDQTVLKNVTFSVDAGERISLLGPGGCGKTTLLKLLVGLLPTDHGEISVLGHDIDQLKSDSQKRQLLRKVGVAFQQGALFDFMTVRDNLFFAMEHMTELTSEEMGEKAKSLLGAVKIPHTENMFPYELSGGMQRRVGIARALCTDPTIALFDEPTAGLDPVTSTIILNMILELAGRSDDRSLIVSTSNVEIAIRFADRVVVLHEGTVVADGPWRELIVSGDPWVQHFLSVRLIGVDRDYAEELRLPKLFIERHWQAR